MTSFLKLFGARVRQLRAERGLSVKELAERLDYDVSTFHALERGEHGVRLQLIVDLAAELGVDESDLLNFPEVHVRAELVELTRRAPVGVLVETKEFLERKLAEETGGTKGTRRKTGSR
jgi:transcriptional regulator with XRE-family HTH domain